MAVRIVCINKDGGNHDNPHEAVSHYGWLNEETGKSEKIDRESMVAWMEEKHGHAYVGTGANKVYCRVNRSARGTKFLQTYADNTWLNNLLSLPECG